MAVYKGVGKHNSSQRPAMHFDRSADSSRLYNGTFQLIMLIQLTGRRTSTLFDISLPKICDLRMVCSHNWAIFGPHENTLNKLE